MQGAAVSSANFYAGHRTSEAAQHQDDPNGKCRPRREKTTQWKTVNFVIFHATGRTGGYQYRCTPLWQTHCSRGRQKDVCETKEGCLQEKSATVRQVSVASDCQHTRHHKGYMSVLQAEQTRQTYTTMPASTVGGLGAGAAERDETKFTGRV